MPNPAAAFSPLTMTRSSASSRRRRGTFSVTTARPERPTTSPQSSILIAGSSGDDRDACPYNGKWMEPLWPLALHYLRGPLTQVGTIYRYHGTGRDSPLGVIIGPRVFAT